MRKAISLMLALLMCLSLSLPVGALTVYSDTVQPYYEITRAASSELSISGTTATCKSTCKGGSDVVTITAVQTLEKQGFWGNWSTYDDTTWTKTVNSNTLTMSNTKSGLENGNYRLKTVFTLTGKSGKSETVTVYSDEKAV